jgi:homoserine dehydrogenase
LKYYLQLKLEKMKKINIGLFCFGCVGSGLYKVLEESNNLDAKIIKIVAKNPNKKREFTTIPISYNSREILEDESINVVVELINNSAEAYTIIKEALQRKKHVVTANKKVLAENLAELIALAKENGVSLLYEAAVAGSIPIIRNLEEYYNNDLLTSIEGVLNGTSNYILTQSNNGIAYSEALLEAQEKGFAESDPTLDVDGFDSIYKLTILLKHAFGAVVPPSDLLTVGIRNLKKEDVRFVKEKGFRIKLLAKAYVIENKLFAYLAPHIIESSHATYNVDNEFNAVLVQAAYADKQLFYGKGAGSFPTASAVLSDISALRYNYAYEYRRTNLETRNLSQSLLLKVYIGSDNINTLSEFNFNEIEDLYIGKDYAYQVGFIQLEDLLKVDWNKRNDLSLLVFSENKSNNQSPKKTISSLNLLKNQSASYSIH